MVRAIARDADEESVVHRNEVFLVGKVSGEPQERELPSGDLIVSVRLVVRRAPSKSSKEATRKGPVIDTIYCTAWLSAARRTMLGLAPGDTVEVTGAVHRRFWKVGGALASRYEVEVAKVRRIARAQLSA